MANASPGKYRSPFKTFKPFNRCAPFQSLTDQGSFKVQAFKVQRQLALVQVVQNVRSLRSIQTSEEKNRPRGNFQVSGILETSKQRVVGRRAEANHEAVPSAGKDRLGKNIGNPSRLFQSQEPHVAGDGLPQPQQLETVSNVSGRVAEHRFAKLFFQANSARQAQP